jgi:hypothetical protein
LAILTTIDFWIAEGERVGFSVVLYLLLQLDMETEGEFTELYRTGMEAAIALVLSVTHRDGDLKESPEHPRKDRCPGTYLRTSRLLAKRACGCLWKQLH